MISDLKYLISLQILKESLINKYSDWYTISNSQAINSLLFMIASSIDHIGHTNTLDILILC